MRRTAGPWRTCWPMVSRMRCWTGLRAMGWLRSSRGRYAPARGGLPLSGWRSPKPVSERLPTSGWSSDTQSEPPTPFWACADARLGGAAVSDYRVYFIGRDGHFLRAIDTEGHEVEV